MKNQVQLCTYVDRLGQGNLNSLRALLHSKFADIFGGVHLLPFYYPIDGADAGFDPIDHASVDTRLGGWQGIANLSKHYDVMADVIVNHMSCHSAAFQDFKQHGENSSYAPLFLTFDKVFPQGAKEEDLLSLYRPRPGLPFNKVKLESGEEKLLWTTFTADQIDIDVDSEQGKAYLANILNCLQEAKVKMIRLDAAGYAIKRAGTSCFMTDDTFAFIDTFTQQAQQRGMEVLVEIHSHYLTQVEISKKASWVYDFALPPLVLHTLTAKDSLPLQKWYEIAPRNAINVLDTHDGIGIIDVAADPEKGPGLLSDKQVDTLVETIHNNSRGESRKATGAAANNVDLYQVNCTYYEALGANDNTYLLARLIQMFSPGIPQVYYVGLLAGKNDMELLATTGVGRDINRHHYSEQEIDAALTHSVVDRLLALLRMRSRHKAFQQGRFRLISSSNQQLKLSWQAEKLELHLEVDLPTLSFALRETRDDAVNEVRRWEDIEKLAY